MLLYVDRVCISTAKGPIMRDLGLSSKQFGWVLAAFAFSYALFQIPCGAIADRFGPRRLLAGVVVFWSLFTGLTAAAWNFASLVAIRTLFGAGEAGALPGTARAVYSWIPVKERGIVKGVNFSGSRLGAALTMPVMPWMIGYLGWHRSFTALMAAGFGWAAFWWLWFRDEPAEHRGISPAELAHIHAYRQETLAQSAVSVRPLPLRTLLGSRNLWLMMGQYFANNCSIFFCLTWLPSYIIETYHLGPVEGGFYAAAPLIAAAAGNIFSGWVVDRMFKAGCATLSRRLPAIIGFTVAIVGILTCVRQETALGMTAWLSLGMFGADMVISPSWSMCIDIGGRNSGAVSGAMNSFGNFGGALTSVGFPYLLAWTGGPLVFFYIVAMFEAFAIVCWLLVRPERKLGEPVGPAGELAPAVDLID